MDFKVLDVWITPKGNLLISYQETKNGRSIGRVVSPQLIDVPPTPPIDLGSIWE